MQGLEILVQKLSTEVLDLSNKLAAGEYGTANKTELDEEPELEVAPAKKNCLDRVMEPTTKGIKTFLENVGAWNAKLDELFKDSQLQAKIITDMADSHQGLEEMEHKLADLETKLDAMEINTSKDDEELGSHSGAS